MLVWFGSPVATRDFEQSGGQNQIVSKADDRRGGRSVIPSGREADTIVKLGEQLVDGRWGVPWNLHAKSVCVEFDLGDLAPGGPEMGEDGETGDAAQAKFGISEAAKVIRGDGG